MFLPVIEALLSIRGTLTPPPTELLSRLVGAHMACCFISRPSLTKNAFVGAAYTTKAYGMHPLCHPLEVLAKSANFTFASQKNVRNGLSPEQCY